MGRGWRHRFYATGIPGRMTLTPEQEVADLKAQAEWLKGQLDAIQKRIEELESK
jgi:ubiquinone biosynthesis protein UbiJ